MGTLITLSLMIVGCYDWDLHDALYTERDILNPRLEISVCTIGNYEFVNTLLAYGKDSSPIFY